VIVGLGMDVVDVARIRRILEGPPDRVERFLARVFTRGERATCDAVRDRATRYAARFAAKEAVMKALGVGLGAFAFHDVEVLKLDSGAPDLRVTGTAAVLAGERGVTAWQISLSHSVTTAGAVVSAL
jgi:holo-[acyl-carrier protein] synthase